MVAREDESPRQIRARLRLTARSRLTHLECARCSRALDADVVQRRCDCGGTLLARYDLSGVDLAELRRRDGGTWRYRELLPVRGDPVTLGEPETALVPARRFSERWGLDVFVKDDGTLPGGTFKARGAAVGLSRARELGVERVVMPSAGNAGGAWSLYAARAGIDITVTMAKTAPDAAKAEVEVAGGKLVLIDGTLADAGRAAAEMARVSRAFLAATFSEPYRLEGKKSCWLEVFDRLGDSSSVRLPRTIVVPVGGGVGAIAALKAAEEVRALGWTDDPLPRIVGVQAEACAPIERAFARGDDEVEPWEGDTMTIAAGLRVPAPAEGALVLDVIRRSGGRVIAVSDDAIRDAISDLASSEGIFACPEGAATVAATERLAGDGETEGPVVLYNTGTGAKYTDVLADRGTR